ncbi:hypothetical protein N7492_004913 [Penicillium capsulatum]|uniref:CFEM domain-containing protein n=1 Tax=Penicillium capsulatum TaxID=69766 RepID=A0A9W9I8P0_9EURO|nr:hypothetical protein N7492_004913 [Penicillium capsulatum]KAJ6135979.1 hypothetical protein N7512_001139 [Penicillium capsulatum]
MKFIPISLAVTALLSTAAAQGLSDLPNCAKSCATKAIPEKCGIDVACICKEKAFLSSISCCVADKCSKADQETTLKAAKSICAGGGVSDLPNSVVCSSDSSSSTTSTASKTGDSAAKTTDGTTTATGTRTSTDEASSSSAAASSATNTGAAVVGQNMDASLVAAAGAAAAFAFFV